MLKVSAIIGSLRKDSINRKVFNHYKELAQGHFEIEEASIIGFPLYNPDLQDEGMPDSVLKFSEKIRSSNGVIFFSPEYNYSVPGVLKNAIDWASRVESQPFDNKCAAIIGVSPGNIGTARMQYHLRQIGVFLNLNFLNKPEVMIGQSGSKIDNDRIKDEKTVEFLKKHVQQFSEFMGEK